MQAVILAAGQSTRTHPLTVNKPKCLLKVCGKSVLEHNLDELQGLVEEAIIIIGFKGDLIRSRLGSRYRSIRIKYVQQEKPEGTGAALMLAKSEIAGKFLAMNGDDLYSGDNLRECLKHERSVLAMEVGSLESFGQLVLEGGKVIRIDEKPGTMSGLANAGAYVFPKDVFGMRLAKSKRGEYEITDFIKLMGGFNYVAADFWIPMTYPWSLLDACSSLIKRAKGFKKGSIEKGAVLKGDVVVDEGTLIRAGAYIEGPVYIGRDCVIGPNCYIRGSTSIGDKCKIGNAVEVKNSVIGDGTSVGHLSYVGDSVLGDGVNFGAGTITANLRHDNANIKSQVKGVMVDSNRRKFGAIIGDGVHTGIHTSIYPGRKLWPESSTLPGEIVKKDIGG